MAPRRHRHLARCTRCTSRTRLHPLHPLHPRHDWQSPTRWRRCVGTRGERAGTDAPGGWAIAHLDAATGPVGHWRAGGRCADDLEPGPGRHAYLGIRLSGRDPTSDQRRSNISGLGARVAVRTASRWTAFDNTRLESGPGQSLQPMSIGLGGAPRADFVAITWSDGVFQTELALDARQAASHWRNAASAVELSRTVRVGRQPLPVRDRRARRRRHWLLRTSRSLLGAVPARGRAAARRCRRAKRRRVSSSSSQSRWRK